MLIEYTEPRIHILRGSREDGRQIEFEFRPGAENEVPDDVWENLQEHSIGCRSLLNEGKLKGGQIRLAKSAPSSNKRGGDTHPSEKVGVAAKFPPRKGQMQKVDVGDHDPAPPATVGTMADVDIGKMTSYDAVSLTEKVYKEGTLEQFEGLPASGSLKQAAKELHRSFAAMSLIFPSSSSISVVSRGRKAWSSV